MLLSFDKERKQNRLLLTVSTFLASTLSLPTMNVSDRFRNGRFYFFDEGSRVMKDDNRVILLSTQYTTNCMEGGGSKYLNVNTAIFLIQF